MSRNTVRFSLAASRFASLSVWLMAPWISLLRRSRPDPGTIPCLSGSLVCVVLIVSSVSAQPGPEQPADGRGADRSLPFRVSTLAGDGSPLSSFVATYDDMHISNVTLGSDGNIWLTRADNSHGYGVPNPNDMVAVYTVDGVELNTISGGGMRHPRSIARDGTGAIYVAAEDIFFNTDVYKYTAAGGYLTKFHTAGWSLIDEYNDIVITDDDRLFVSSWHGTGNDDQMTVFSVAGATLDTFSPTGPSYFHRDMALAEGQVVWVRTPRNGSGSDLVRAFDLAGNQIDSFATDSGVPGSNMRGLEVDQGGTIYTLDVNTQTLYGFDDDGIVLSSTPLGGLSTWITDFTFGPGGTILVANQALQTSDVVDAAPGLARPRLVAVPNPFRDRVELRVDLPGLASAESRVVDLDIYDVRGRLVRTLAVGTVGTVGTAGVAVPWDGADAAGSPLAAGTYYLRVEAGGVVETGLVALIR